MVLLRGQRGGLSCRRGAPPRSRHVTARRFSEQSRGASSRRSDWAVPATFAETAEKLERAWRREVRVLGLEVTDREAILRVLDDGPEGLAELRAVLLQELVWRRAEGLA